MSNQKRAQAMNNGSGHKQASSSLAPFADLLLNATDLAHRCEYAPNERERKNSFAEDTPKQIQLPQALKIRLPYQRRALSLRIPRLLSARKRQQIVSSLSDRSQSQNKSFRYNNSSHQLHLQVNGLPETRRSSRKMLRTLPTVFPDPYQRSHHNSHWS